MPHKLAAHFLLWTCLLTADQALAAPRRGGSSRKAAPAASRPPPPPPAPESTPTPAARREANEAAQESAGVALGRRGPTRVDFDDRLVQGQSTKQGAIYLFERKESAMRSMLRKRENFRREIADSIE